MNTLIEETRRTFGDLASKLIETGAVFPVNKNKVPVVKWKGPVDPTQFNGRSFYGYGVKTGAASGITGVDFDGLVTPNEFNVKTRRGFHAWTEYRDGDRNSSNALTKVDIRGDGGYLVFSSPTHKVLRNDLLPREDFLEYLSPTSLTTNSSNYMKCEGVWNMGSEHPYVTEIKAYGYEVKIDWLARRLATTVAEAPEGARNHTLYVAAVQVHHLGGTEAHEELLRNAAYDAGLDGRDIHKTLASAMNAPGVIPVFHIAREWAEQADAELKSRRVKNTIITEHVVRLATEQHSLRPLVSLQGLEAETGITRKSLRGQLTMLVDAGLLHKKVNEGRQANGNRHSNNYVLLGRP